MSKIYVFRNDYPNVISEIFSDLYEMELWIKKYFNSPDWFLREEEDLGSVHIVNSRGRDMLERNFRIRIHYTDEHVCPVCKGHGLIGYTDDLCYECHGSGDYNA